MIKYNIHILFLIFILFLACDKNILENNVYNLFGGYGRTNSYENIRTVYQRLLTTEYPEPISDSSGLLAPPLILSDEKICLSSVNGNIILTAKEKVLWEYKLGIGEVVVAGMCADFNQNIYFVSNKGILYSLNIDGKYRWSLNIYDTVYDSVRMADLLSINDRIVVSSDNGTITSIDSNGGQMWQRISNINSTQTYSADEKGNIAINMTFDEFTQTDTLIFINKDGNEIWSKPFQNVRLIRSPVIYKNKIYVIGIHTKSDERLSKIYVFNTDGTLIWDKEVSIFLRFISVDKDENVYVTGYNAGLGEVLSGIYCYSIEGNLLWNIFFEMSIPSPIVITKDFLAVTGITRKAPGLFILTKQGVLSKTISLSDAPTIFPLPNVSSHGNIIYASTEKLALIKIDETLLNKILPY